MPKGSGGHSVYRSQDEGLTWDTLTSPIDYGHDIWAYDNRLYVSNITELYRTDTNGENWSSVAPPLAASEYINDVFAHGQHLLVSSSKKLWHSHDEGQTWSAYATNFEKITLVGNTLFGKGGTTGLAKSDNFGLSWTELPVSEDLDIFALATIDGKALAATYNHGVFRWEEATQAAVEANNGLLSAAVYSLAQGDNKVWASTGTGVFAYDPSQQSWTAASTLPFPTDYYETVAANDSGLICAVQAFEDHFYLSTDNGVSWNAIYPDPGVFGGSTVEHIKLIDHVIFIESHSQNWARSADFGQTWQPVGDVANSIYMADVFQFQGQYMAVSYPGKFYISPDQGLSWNFYATFPGSLIQVFVASDRLFAAANTISGANLYTSANGIDWQYAQDGLPSNVYNNGPGGYQEVDFFGANGHYYCYHSEAGFYATTDTGKTWLPVERRPYHHVTMQDSLFYAGSFGGGVIQSGLPNVYGALATGTVFKDDNANGIRDTGESGLPEVRVSVDAPDAWNPFYMTTTRDDGSYVLGVLPGAYDTLRPLLHFAYVDSILPPYRLVGNGGTDLDFGVKLTPNITDLAIYAHYAGRPRPGFDLALYTQYTNAGTTEPGDAVLSVKLAPGLIYLDATPPPTAVFGDSLVWSLAQLPLFGAGYLQINTQVPATMALGTELTTICRLNTPATDAKPIDNQSIASDTVVGSYDPNEKRVAPADGLTAAEIAAGKDLLYTIQFQNTGTYPADRVRITDMIDTALYQPSLRLIAASHPVTTFRLLPGGLLEIVLEDIMLSDSNSNEPSSHGFVTFAVQRKKAFNPNYKVRNHAAIFFDFNEPILTNEVITPLKKTVVSVTEPAGKQVPDLRIFPNPADQIFTVSTEGRLSGPGLLLLQNTAGQVCQQMRVPDLGAPIVVQTNGLPEGIYLIRLLGGDQSVAGKLVVQRK